MFLKLCVKKVINILINDKKILTLFFRNIFITFFVAWTMQGPCIDCPELNDQLTGIFSKSIRDSV